MALRRRSRPAWKELRGEGQNLKLDSEGGAQVTTPKTRYLTTGIQVMLAASQLVRVIEMRAGPRQRRRGGKQRGERGIGFSVRGNGCGDCRHVASCVDRIWSVWSGDSIYYHFLARGRDVVYPKDMAMVIGFGTREGKAGGF